MPNYVAVTKSSFLEFGNMKRHKQLVEMKGKRLIWIDEFNAKRPDTEFIKTVSAPLVDMENEVMFGTIENIKIMFKIFALTTQMPIFKEDDPAIYNRYKQISFLSHFDRHGRRETEEPDKLLFIADTGLDDKLIANYADEIINIVIDYAHKYNTKGMPKIPDTFMKDTKEAQKKNDTFQLWFDDNCIHSEGKKLPLKLVTEKSYLKDDAVKAGMARLGLLYDEDLCKMEKDHNNKYYKGGFLGCAWKPEEVEEEEDGENNKVEGHEEEKM
jgi:phage/plasmid-associated DNA primase